MRKVNMDEGTPLLAPPNQEENEVELSKCGGSICCDPRRGVHKYFVLIIICFLSFGSYFCYDNPGALQDIIKQDMDVNTSKYMMLYALYSWPNVILCFFGGFLIDKVFGIRVGAILFAAVVTVGQLLFAFGALWKAFFVMEIGRFVFGLGGESLAVAQNTYAVSWFMGKELNMVFGLQLSFSRVGSTVNFLTMEKMYDWMANYMGIGHKNLGTCLLIAGGFCILSLLCALALAFFDWRASKILQKNRIETGEVVHITDVKNFPLTFWLLSIICVAYYVAVFPFIGLGLVFFEMKYGYSPSKADSVNSIVYILSAVASPIFGYLIDRTGKAIFWIIIGIVFTILPHALFAFTFTIPEVQMVIMGLAYSVLASALWPLVAIVIPEHQLGTAYGIMQSVQNLGLAVISQVTGILVDSKGYLYLEVFFLAWLCVALIAAVVLYLIDASRGGKLNWSAKQKQYAANLERSLKND